ncbi:HupE/UreJ family protein [Ottowia sp.]|uniref:HupE/UreJ family protein n=1 Tax=Ottowia sp. TaxID=1898956 RepID=UPI003A8C5167
MKIKATSLLACPVLMTPAVALAHTGVLADHTHTGFAAGLLHPLTGADHLAAMLAVGVWSALAVRPVWLAPLAFVGMLLAGALAAQAGLVLPGVEPMIAASLLVLGLLVAMRARLPRAAAVGLCGLFAFFHGAAHGAELGDGAAAWSALAGMVVATAALHASGIGLGRWVLARRQWLARFSGAAVALLGAALLLRLV